MNTKHTPGPWAISMHRTGDGAHVPIIQAGTVRAGHAAVAHPVGVTDEQMHANARLIAAAPDLLATLETIASQCGTFAERQPALDYASIGNIARAAIFKAKGEA